MAMVTIYTAALPSEREASHQLLYRAAQHYSGLTEDELGPLSTGAQGKPAFSRQEHLHFSISHSGRYWVCGFSDDPLGLDIQEHQSHMQPERLSRRFFHPLEDAYLAHHGYTPFFDLWAAKESWVKFTGRGFYDTPESFSVVSEQGDFPALASVFFRLIPFAAHYSLCLCTASPCEIRFVSLA